MKKTSPIFTPNMFQELFDSIFHERNEAIKTYLDFYYKSGIMDYFADSLRAKYKIPKSLDPRLDYNSGTIASEYGEYDEEYSSWVTSSTRKKAIEKDIKMVMRTLYLPSTAYNYLQYYFVYKEKYSESYPLYNFVEITLNIINQVETEEFTGYTDEELKFIKFLIHFVYLKNHDLDIMDLLDKDVLATSREAIAPYYKVLDKRSAISRRSIRKLVNVDEDAELVRQLKIYKKHRTEIDEVTQEYIQVKITSERLVEVVMDVELEKIAKKKRATLRKRIQRLLSKFPFLTDYILDKSPL